jgi:hypothetical protein
MEIGDIMIFKKLILYSVALALTGCSAIAVSNRLSTENIPTRVINEAKLKKWHLFHKDRNYRFRNQSLDEDVNWNDRKLKLLQIHGYKQSIAKFNTPNQFMELAMETSLQDVRLIRKVGVSSTENYKIPVIFYEISSKSPHGSVERYVLARMLDGYNLNKIVGCLKPAPRFKEGWAPTYLKGTPIIAGQCFRPRE